MHIWILDGEKMEQAIALLEALYEGASDHDKDLMILCLEQMWKIRDMAIRIRPQATRVHMDGLEDKVPIVGKKNASKKK